MKNKIYGIAQKLRRIFYIVIYNIFVKMFRCKEDRILLATNTKTKLSGNLLYVYEELQKYDYDIRIICVNKGLVKIIKNIELLYYIATSKYILIDDFWPLLYALKIRKNAKFIQVWHALGAYKRVGFSRKDVGNENSISHKNYTDTIMSSDSIVKNYAESFGISEDKVHPIGIPRTDFFFNQGKIDKKKEEIYSKYPGFKAKRIILFAPTFRGSGRKLAHYPEEYIDLDKIYECLTDNDILIIKLHPFTKNRLEIKEEYKDKIYDLNTYSDINELLIITDLLITDYSSVIFEYSFMKRPIIFYVPDLEEYYDSRSFYYEFEEYVYGSVAKNMDELLENINNPKIDLKKLKKFKEKFLNKCDGKSTERFVKELILK